MLAAKFRGKGNVQLVDMEIPNVSSNEVLIRVAYCGLCGSDKRLFYNGTEVTPGHEISGEVVEVGENVDLPEGTRGIVYIPLFCGICEECLSGNNNRCPNMKGLVGWQVPGGYAEYLVIPAKNFIPLPPDIGLDEGILLLDTIGTPAHGIRMCLNAIRARLERAAVIGCGPLGLGALLVLQAMGCEQVYVSDVMPTRQQMALELGGIELETKTFSLDSSFPLVIEASGSQEGRELALNLVKAGGAVLWLGESDNPFVITPSPKLRRKDAYYVRSFYFPLNEVEDNFGLFRGKREKFKKLISKVGYLSEIENMYRDFFAGQAIKSLIKIGVR